MRLRVPMIAAVALLALPGSALADPYVTPPDDVSGPAPLAPTVNNPSPAPNVSGSPQVGGKLVGNQGTWASDVSLSSRWLRCNPAANFCDPTSDTDLEYTVTAADQGAVMVLRVAGTKNGFVVGSSRTRYADAISNPISAAPPGPTAPTNVTRPTISGNVREGQLLRVSLGQWTGTGPITYTSGWASCSTTCRAVSSSSTYRVAKADVGRKLLAGVVGRNAVGSGLAQVATGVVARRAPKSRLKRLSPFPTLLIDGRVAGALTSISTLRLRRVPGGSTINISCKGRGCPFRKNRVKVRRGKSRTVALTRLQRRMRANTVVVITVRKGNTMGKYIRLRFRRGLAPARVDRCVQPKSSKPRKCP